MSFDLNFMESFKFAPFELKNRLINTTAIPTGEGGFIRRKKGSLERDGKLLYRVLFFGAMHKLKLKAHH